MELRDIQVAIAASHFRITDHADEEMAADGFILDDVLSSAMAGEIMEDYPSSYPLPSCLVYGLSKLGDQVHSVWAYNEASAGAVLITCYRPDPNRWIDGRKKIR